VDLGAGTGFNVELMEETGLLEKFDKIYLVDLSPSLLEQARQRIKERRWTNVHTVEADATTWQPDEGAVDLVTFSYSLTMIPDWFAAIDHAKSLLKPGGVIGVCDFYVARKYPEGDLRTHSWFTRTAWPTFFAFDNVNLSRDHLPFLRLHFRTLCLGERMGSVPYIPFFKCPYYFFVGGKRNTHTD
jgi:S-adenosylmethionine-diacylgycerolhomoserine-N-methlytransferase